ncbi:MAG: 5-(carboxyamino)imidazole ribonucleotide synthase [Rhodoferax sp.]
MSAATPPTGSAQVLRPGSMGADGQAITLGVMGGGQLGRMFVHAAQAMGYYTAVLDPDPISPAGRVSHYHVQTDYLDQDGLAQMLQRCAAITTEFENVPAPALLTLGAARPTAPTADAVAIAQDRIQEKVQLARSGVAVAPYAVIASADDLAQVSPTLFPGILKTARLGYDGKGQVRVEHPNELASAWQALGQVPCVLEQRLPLAQECSVIVARNGQGDCVAFPVQRNLHHNGILAVTEVYEENVPSALAEQAVEATKKIANELHYVGVLCVEFFILQPDSTHAQTLGPLIVNEMAPRPHNSGHYTLDACDVSQFDLQVRTLAGLPLVQPRQHSAAVMLNLLGDLWHPDGSAPDWCSVLALPGAHLHLYGKLQARPGRKMGHLTLTAPSAEQALATARQAAQLLGLPAF